MADNDWKKRLGVVFSTNPDFAYEQEAEQEEETLELHEIVRKAKLTPEQLEELLENSPITVKKKNKEARN